MIEIQTEKFTQNTLSIRWFFDLERSQITAWNLLAGMLSARSEKFPSRQAFRQACAHAYDLDSYFTLMSYGEKMMLEYRMSWIRSGLIGSRDYTAEVVELMDQALRHPFLSEESLQEAVYLLQNRLRSIEQDPDTRAVREALKAAGKGTPLEISVQGYLEDLSEISLDQIEDLAGKLAGTPCQTLVLGTLEPSVRKYLETFFPGTEIEARWSAVPVRPVEEVVIEKEISQSSLVQVYATGILPEDPLYFALLVLNGLLGSSSVALLFEIIREQNSLCYSIDSVLIRFDGLLMISTAACREDLFQVKELIADIIEEIRHEHFSLETFETVKKELCHALQGEQDFAAVQIEQEFLNEILPCPVSLPQMIEKIQEVTPRQTALAAQKLHLISSAELVEKWEEDESEEVEENECIC